MEINDEFVWSDMNDGPDSMHFSRITCHRDYRCFLYGSVVSQLKFENLFPKLFGEMYYHSLSTRFTPPEHHVVFTTDRSVYRLNYSNHDRKWWLTTAASTMERAEEVMEQLKNLIPPLELEEDSPTLEVGFWSIGNNGPVKLDRDIVSIAWGDIKDNYPSGPRGGIEKLMAIRPPIDGGSLVLWHGPPGVGKTHCLRALSQAWRPWCDVNYIVDPEHMFGQASYLMQVLFEQENDSRNWRHRNWSNGYKQSNWLTGKDRWRLLVMEDADEFIRLDAKDRQGQALSRLLNTADGLIGQGLQIITLITTNESVSALHEAVSREGRCMANVEFTKFTPAEARTWLENKDIEPGSVPTTDVPLSHLYDMLRKEQQIQIEFPKVPVGQYM